MRDNKQVKLWEFKQAAQLDTLDIYIYGFIEPDYYDWWSGEVVESETSANHFKSELEKYPDIKFINIYVNSNGGDVMEAMGIRNQLVRHSAYVTGYVDGFACSAASFILTACDKVIMYSNTMQMLHLMWQWCCGNYKQLRKAADNLEQISIGNRQAYIEKSQGKLSEEKIVEILDNETWLTAEQCLAYGLADEIVKEEKDLNQAKQMLQQMNQSIQQQISYNKALVATWKQMEAAPKRVPKQEHDPEPPKENKTVKLMAALFR